MRKRYSVSLDEEKAETVKTALTKSNMTLSGFLNMTINEFYNNLVELSELYKKDPKDLTPTEFMAAIMGMMERNVEKMK